MIPELRVQRASLRCFDPDPNERWLFLFAHPDDELAVAGWLNRLQSTSAEVVCAWAHSTPTRESESRRAMGIAADRAELRFGDAPDGRFVQNLPALSGWVRNHLSEFSPSRVVVTAYEQGHLDHDSLSFVASKCAPCPVFEYPMYHHYGRWIQRIGQFADPEGEEIMSLTEEERALKRELLDCYPSQTVRRNIRLVELLSWLLPGQSKLFEVERLRPQPAVDPAQTIHRGREQQLVERSREWKHWLRRTSELVGSV